MMCVLPAISLTSGCELVDGIDDALQACRALEHSSNAPAARDDTAMIT